MALLVPEVTRATQISLVGALADHNGSPGRLADYQRRFEKTVQQDGEDPSKLAVALETLAVKAFGDMDPNTRTRLICDQVFCRTVPSQNALVQDWSSMMAV